MKAILHRAEWMLKGVMIDATSEEIEIPKKGSLEYLQKLVDGYIEVYHHKGRDLVINEEGLLIGLPLNPWAFSQGLELVGNVIEIEGVLP